MSTPTNQGGASADPVSAERVSFASVIDRLRNMRADAVDAGRTLDAATLADTVAVIQKMDHFVAWMRKRTDELNKFNSHTTLSMFLRKLDEVPASNE